MKYKILNLSLYLISILAGALVVYLGEQTTSMFIPFVNTTIVFLILKVIVVISTIILNKKAGYEYDHDGRIKFTLIFIGTQFAIYLVAVYLQTHKIFDTVISLIIILFYNFIPFIALCDGSGNLSNNILGEKKESEISNKNPYKSSKTNINDIKYSQIDNFGNRVYKNKDGTVNDEVAFSKQGNFGETVYYNKSGDVIGTSRKDNFGNEQYRKK